jgi:antitoxin VapB
VGAGGRELAASSTGHGRIDAVPTLNIKDPEVYRLASRLAARRNISMTAAVRQALEESLNRTPPGREGIADKLMEIGRRAAAKDAPWLTDDDLYDENGLPK